MTEQELAAESDALARVSEILDQLSRFLGVWLVRGDSSCGELFAAEHERLLTEHKEAAMRLAVLTGVPPAIAELEWREWRAAHTGFTPPDPSVLLTETERAELDRWRLERQAANAVAQRERDEYRARYFADMKARQEGL